MRFIDEVEIEVRSGRGGRGSSTMRREKYVPMGGPDGGDGGRGGHVVFAADEGVQTLMDLRSHALWRAADGGHGGRRQMTGAQGEDLVIRVPVGTIVRDAGTEDVLFELVNATDVRIAAPGGKGGLGNIHFKTSTNRAPRETTPGQPGVSLKLKLELRLMADVGLLGYPNAGKSTFIATVSAARPKVADYPFTTLVPNLGVVSMGTEGSFVIADIPGLIEGAADGKGLGLQFLRHLQRTRMLLHLVSLSPDEEETVAARHGKLRRELGRYDPELLERPELLVLTKADVADPETIAEAKASLPEGAFVISAVTGEGVQALIHTIWTRLRETRA